MIELVIAKPGGAPFRLRLQGGSYGLGRAETNEIVLDDKEVSRRHARILIEGDVVVVKDLGSGNGTYVGGRSLKEGVVPLGGTIEILPFTIKVERPAQPDAACWLDCVAGRSEGQRFELVGEAMSIGRQEEQDIHIDDPGASRSHAMLVYRDETWSIRDNGSANGLFLNGRRVTDAVLRPEDVIRIGDTQLVFMVADEGVDIEFEEDHATIAISRNDLDLRMPARMDSDVDAAQGPASSTAVVGLAIGLAAVVVVMLLVAMIQ